MRVFIANFGQGNYLWPECLRRSTVATVENVHIHPFWVARDRPGYIEYAVTHLKTALGKPPTRPVASRWFGVSDVVSETNNDLWFHRSKDQLWWTTSLDAPAETALGVSGTPDRDGPRIYELHKQCLPWSDRSRRGTPLSWGALHPKAKHFLFTEGTLQQLSPDNAEYAIALINGDDLTQWHNRPDWKAVAAKAKQSGGVTYDRLGVTAYRMVRTALTTVANSNGQETTSVAKNKESHFSSAVEFECYVQDLFKGQDGCCAITGIPLQLDGEDDDPEMRCSLDRIDSSGHYSPNNLQIVCKFVNRWKGAGNDAEFRRLISVTRASGV